MEVLHEHCFSGPVDVEATHYEHAKARLRFYEDRVLYDLVNLDDGKRVYCFTACYGFIQTVDETPFFVDVVHTDNALSDAEPILSRIYLPTDEKRELRATTIAEVIRESNRQHEFTIRWAFTKQWMNQLLKEERFFAKRRQGPLYRIHRLFYHGTLKGKASAYSPQVVLDLEKELVACVNKNVWNYDAIYPGELVTDRLLAELHHATFSFNYISYALYFKDVAAFDALMALGSEDSPETLRWELAKDNRDLFDKGDEGVIVMLMEKGVRFTAIGFAVDETLPMCREGMKYLKAHRGYAQYLERTKTQSCLPDPHAYDIPEVD